ncbi:MAG: phosphate signaling complex protein PhoU [Candidatus Acidiferrales bacterium]
MERHFVRELDELRERLLWMGSLAERAVQQSVQAILEADARLARNVIEQEDAVNEMQIEIDDRVLHLLALQQLMAADLRLVLAVARINADLERIGDQAVNIAESAQRIMRHPRVKPYVDLPRMGQLAQEMVRDSLTSVVNKDVELARRVLARDDQVDSLRDQVFRELLTYMMENSSLVFPAFELILVAKNLERVADHATNIAEDVIYMVAGRDVRHHGATPAPAPEPR